MPIDFAEFERRVRHAYPDKLWDVSETAIKHGWFSARAVGMTIIYTTSLDEWVVNRQKVDPFPEAPEAPPAPLVCPRCHSNHVRTNGKIHNGKQNFKCRDCGRQFVQNPQNTILRRNWPMDFPEFERRVRRAYPNELWDVSETVIEHGWFSARAVGMTIVYTTSTNEWVINGQKVDPLPEAPEIVYMVMTKCFMAIGESYPSSLYSSTSFADAIKTRQAYEQGQREAMWKGTHEEGKFWIFWVESDPATPKSEELVYRHCFNREHAAAVAKIWRQAIEQSVPMQSDDETIQVILDVEEEDEETRKPPTKMQLDHFEYLLSQFLVYEYKSSTDYRPDMFICQALKLAGMDNGLFSMPIKAHVSKGRQQERSIVYKILDKEGEILLEDFRGWESL